MHLLSLNNDVPVAIISSNSDMESLRNLLVAFPALQELYFNAFTPIARAILTTILGDPEMYRYMFAVITARCCEPRGCLHDFLSYFFNDYTSTIAVPEYVSVTWTRCITWQKFSNVCSSASSTEL